MSPSRVRGYDVLRGFSVCSMVVFHFCYDLKFISGMSLSWFAPPLQDIWRASIAWTFLFVAGCMCCYSRNNLRRAGRYLLVALAIFVATSLIAVDTPISFGIIYCMGACTLMAHGLVRLRLVPYGPVATGALVISFVTLLHLPAGYVGLGGLTLALPNFLYATPLLSWLGLPGPGFASGDYYPLLPFALMYFAGMAMGGYWKDHGAPRWLARLACPPLEFVGRHALEAYVLHQPVLLLLSALVAG